MARATDPRRSRDPMRRAYGRAEDLNRLVRNMPAGDVDWATLAPRIISTLAGDGDAFRLLDERPGHFDGYSRGERRGYHSFLRIVRNSPVYGPQLFQSFRR